MEPMPISENTVDEEPAWYATLMQASWHDSQNSVSDVSEVVERDGITQLWDWSV